MKKHKMQKAQTLKQNPNGLESTDFIRSELVWI